MVSGISRLLAKIYAIGFYQSFQVLQHRVVARKKKDILRKRALVGKTEHTWQEIKQKHTYTKSFELFLIQRKIINLSFLKHFENINEEALLKTADEIVHNNFEILGSKKQIFNKIPWHTDIRLQAQKPKIDCAFDKATFYDDISIFNSTQEEYKKDIKVPWELSRFQHLLPLGLMYKKTVDLKYAHRFVKHIEDWLQENPYLFGINWLNPMEVGIRAINWIVAFEYFKSEPSIPSSFWQRFICSLYDQMHFLEHNWEFYDSRTNNHYLSNLVGYFYLCWFFDDLGISKKRDWCLQEIMHEVHKQVFAEGMSYEGSTTYHKLVTELLVLFYVLAQEKKLEVPSTFEEKLHKMIGALQWLTPVNGELVAIGDDDSGKILWFDLLSLKSINALLSKNEKNITGFEQIKNFPSFGISVVKTDKLHVTLRNHAYQRYQPSGHFHNDMGSITLAINGISVIVDPGSYIYTGSVYWRNYFRSVKQHNTFYLEGSEPVQLTNDLFLLNLPVGKCISKAKNNTFESTHNVYSEYSLEAKRKFTFDQRVITIVDSWQGSSKKSDLKTCWNFTLAPTIKAEKKDKSILLFHQNKLLMTLVSDIDWQVKTCWVAQGYGRKINSLCLRAQKALTYSQVKTSFYLERDNEVRGQTGKIGAFKA